MIVEICGTDLLALVNGQQVAIGDLIVREGSESKVIEARVSTPAIAANVEDVRARRSDARRKLVGESKPKKAKKTGQRWMHALFDGPCYMGNCRTYIKKGDRMLYDYDGGRALCEGHGKTEYPNLSIPEEVNA